MAKMLSNAFGKALRETGQALDRVGLTVSNTEIFRETLSRHRPIMSVLSQVHRRLFFSFHKHIL